MHLLHQYTTLHISTSGVSALTSAAYSTALAGLVEVGQEEVVLTADGHPLYHGTSLFYTCTTARYEPSLLVFDWPMVYSN